MLKVLENYHLPSLLKVPVKVDLNLREFIPKLILKHELYAPENILYRNFLTNNNNKFNVDRVLVKYAI